MNGICLKEDYNHHALPDSSARGCSSLQESEFHLYKLVRNSVYTSGSGKMLRFPSSNPSTHGLHPQPSAAAPFQVNAYSYGA